MEKDTCTVKINEQETCRRAWPEWEFHLVSCGLPCPRACAKHVKRDLQASRVYIIVSKPLSGTGDYLQRLRKAVGEENTTGVRIGTNTSYPI